MTPFSQTSKRIVVVGGGIAGLSAAVRLAQAGFPVTVLEASKLGVGASTRNQGWLYSGACFAMRQPELAKLCHESLLQTLKFCPECIEADSEPMVYLFSNPDTEFNKWTSAWDETGIPYARLDSETLFNDFSGLALSRAGVAFQLPDVAMRSDVLLLHLANAAERVGVEIRVNTPVARLIQRRESVDGVVTTQGETIPARLVILAGNARGGALFPGYGTDLVGAQKDVALVLLKTHLIAVRPKVSRWPLCVLDENEFNHIPHQENSVFGSNHWYPVNSAEDEGVQTNEIERLWEDINRFFPDVDRERDLLKEWAGVTVQALHLDQIEAASVPLPTVVDHACEKPTVNNLLSIFPGRASLWAHLAEQVQRVVLEKLESTEPQIASPPWRLSL